MTSRFQPPPVIKACERLLVDIEHAVRQFPRYHRYVVGADLRKAAAATYCTANRAWRDQAGRQQWVDRLVWQVDEIKMYLQVAKLVGALASFRQFEHLARQVEGLGAQVGGWRRQLHPSAQNAAAPRGVPQRGQKLSTRAASAGANA